MLKLELPGRRNRGRPMRRITVAVRVGAADWRRWWQMIRCGALNRAAERRRKRRGRNKVPVPPTELNQSAESFFD